MKKDHLSEKAVLAYLSLFATIILFLLSPDSYTHDVYFRVDSACFFTGGKAWMSGMLPYVDFADSKGPLLWLIYGIGYLISHNNYVGVFWISCLSYALTYYFAYKAAMLVLGDTKRAFLCAVLMSLAFFFPHVFYEIRAENFGHLFMMLTIYHTLRLLTKKNLRQREVCRSFFAFGIAFGATLLIKYSFTVMLAPMMLYGLYWLLREKRKWLIPILSALTGVLIVVLPFLIYFIAAGNLSAFIDEYFINTFKTVSGDSLLVSYRHEWGILTEPAILILFVLLMAGAVAMSSRLRKYRLFPIISTFFMFAVAVRHSGPYYEYYFNAPSICLFFLITFTVSKIHLNWRPVTLTAATILVLIVSVLLSVKSEPMYHTLFWQDGKTRTDFYNIAHIIRQVDHPKMMDLCNCGTGIETLPGALPACKYWILQHGSTEEMKAAHKAGVESGAADFIFVKSERWLNEEGLDLTFLSKNGYHLCYEWMGAQLYTKHHISLPEKPSTPSNWDILLKRSWRQ